MEDAGLWKYLGFFLGLNIASGVAGYYLGRSFRKNRIYFEGFYNGVKYMKHSVVRTYLDKHPKSHLKEKENFRITIDKVLLDKAEKDANSLERFI